MERERIMHFALDVLGCGCDHGVFNSIDVDENVMLQCGIMLSKKIVIGRRLLIYIAQADSCAPGDVGSVVADGLAERDGKGYNRLRLVIVAPMDAGLQKVYSDAFSEAAVKDEKCHIHVISPGDAM